MGTNTFKELFSDTDLIVIIDTKGKVMYYEGYNDTINMLKGSNAVGHSIFELYPYFDREDFTVFRAIDQEKPILNEYQTIKAGDKVKQAINSAFPLINDTGVVGAIVISVEIKKKKTDRNKKIPFAKYDFSMIKTQNPIFQDELNKLKKASENDSSILIYGETGTGKELIAHAIHNHSTRYNAPFIIQNCASIPSSLMESILFGTKKGSFTDAEDNEGIFEAARGGSIFLDEINSMPYDLQSKVMRAIENKTIRRIGETMEREIDVRIISASNENLLPMIAKGTFRADLYYRLNVFSFAVPPIRERKEDILLLAEYYIYHYNNLFNAAITGINDEGEKFLCSYSWPGNVRELKNVIEYALNLKKKGELTSSDFPEYLFEQQQIQEENSQVLNKMLRGKTSLNDQMSEIERNVIQKALTTCKYNISKTAQYLNIPRQTLYYKIRKYDI